MTAWNRIRRVGDPVWRFLGPGGVGVVVATGLASFVLRRVAPPDYNKAQLANAKRFAELVKPFASRFQDAALADVVFAVAYGAMLVVIALRVIALRRTDVVKDATWIERFSYILVWYGAIADVGENFMLRSDAGRVAQGLAPTLNDWMRGYGYAKWSFLALGLLALAWTALAPRRPARIRVAASTARPSGARDWDVPEDKAEEKLGVCFSGGGIRSASFSLGVLQALQQRDLLHRTDYLSAVSGGGYVAAGWAVVNALDPPAAGEPARFAPRSVYERHLRNNSSYLIPNLKGGAAALITLISGLLFGLLVIWMALFAISHPVGWLVGNQHPELHSHEPVALVDRAKMPVKIAKVTKLAVDDGTTLYAVHVEPDFDEEQACLDVVPFDTDGGDFSFQASQTRAGVVRVRDDKATIIRQPLVTAVPSRATDDCISPDIDTLKKVLPTIRINPRLQMELKPDALGLSAADLLRDLRIKEEGQPGIVPEVGLLGRDDVEVDGWMWKLSGSFLFAALLIALTAMLLRMQGAWRTRLVRAQFVLGGIGLGALAVLVVFPWLAQFFSQHVLGAVPVEDTGFDAPSIPTTGGLVVVIGLAVRRFFGTDAPSSKSGSQQPGIVKRAWKTLVGVREQLAWYELTPVKIVAGLILVVVPAVLVLYNLVWATANGPTGRLFSLTFFDKLLPWNVWRPEWERVLYVLLILVVLQRFVDTHAWSLQPFYKRRLSDAFFGQDRELYDAGPVKFQDLRDQEAKGFPQLIMCCAVNLSEKGVTPPARRSASFTFSSTEFGGPLVGYVDPDTYWDHMRKSRWKDLTVPAAMSISGAAFSPGMGKFNYGTVGSMFALANLRLGVWLPHPQYVNAMPPGEQWLHRPGWSWFIREIVGRYKRDVPYLYVSDGGHWDNLGLVELLRRGCTEIVCVNAGGDHQDNFDTIGEAMALAREELGVLFNLDPSVLRPPVKAAESGRLLRRKGARSTPEPLAVASYALGSFTYPGENGRTGTIWLIEPALTAGMPFDVHTFAESQANFPDVPTGDQIFNHQQFEAYRALGYHQGNAVLASSRPPRGRERPTRA